MGRIRTAAAKKFIEKDVNSDDDEESIADAKRSSRSNRSANKNGESKRDSGGRANRSTRSSLANNKQNGKKQKNGKANSDSSASGSEDDAPIVNRKRKSLNESVGSKKQKSSESGSPTKKKSNSDSSASDSEDEAPILNRKRRSLNENVDSKKQKTSESSSSSKKKSTENKAKKVSGPKSITKKKKTDEERYEVEEILDHKFEDNFKYFLIRWKGYDSSVDSWERQYNISCPALLAKYYEKHPEASVSAKNVNKKKKKKQLVIKKTLKIDEQLDYDSDFNENEDYEVERIIDVCIHRNNKREFLIRWKGYSSKSDSWEPEENLDCNDLINRFMSKVDVMKNASQKELRPVRSQTQRFTLMTQASARRLSKRNQNRQRTVYYDCDE